MNRYFFSLIAMCLCLAYSNAQATHFIPDGVNCNKYFELDALTDSSKRYANFYIAPRRLDFISNPKSRSYDMTMHFGYDFSRPNTLILIGHVTSVHGLDICVKANEGLGLFVSRDLQNGAYYIPGIQVSNCSNPNEVNQSPYAKVIYALRLDSDLFLRLVNEPAEALLVRIAGIGATLVPMDRPQKERFELQNMLRCASTAIGRNIKYWDKSSLVSHKSTTEEITRQ